MRKAFMVILLLLISTAFVTTMFAQPNPEAKPTAQPTAVAPGKAPAPEKAPAPQKKTTPSARVKLFKGEFVAMDGAAKTIVAKNARGEVTFDVSGVKKMAELVAGDRIMIAYGEKDGKMGARTVAKKAARKAPVRADKKEMPTKEEAKPATDKPAAPAPSTVPAPENR